MASKPSDAQSKRWSYLWTAIGSGLLGAGVFWGLANSVSPDSPLATRLHLNLPGLNQYAEAHTVFALSPDGGSLVFETKEMLYLRELGGLDVSPIPGTEGGYGPFFSPDGEWLGFLTATGMAGLKKPAIKKRFGGMPILQSWCTAIISMTRRLH